MSNTYGCDSHNFIRSSSSILNRAPSWCPGVGACNDDSSDSQESSQITCTNGSSELNAVCPPETTDNESAQSLTRLNLTIPTVYLTTKEEPSSSAYHVYEVKLNSSSGDEWSVYRRYSQFHTLHQQLKARDPAIAKLRFPPKKGFSSRAATIVQGRRIRLEEYMRSLCRYIDKLISTSDGTSSQRAHSDSRGDDASPVETESHHTGVDAAHGSSYVEPTDVKGLEDGAETSERFNTSSDTMSRISNAHTINQDCCNLDKVSIIALFEDFISLSKKGTDESFNPATFCR
mgnify:CR=1 FL=1